MATILLIDDDSQLRGMLKQMLERAGFQVVEAENGPDSLKILKSSLVDIILTDIIMPGQDGVMLIQEILKRYPDKRILAMSGGPKGNAAWLPIAKRVGARAILKKPFTKTKLLALVNETLNALC